MIEWLVQQGYFRNANHAIWFVCTVGMLVVLVIQRLFPRFLWIIPLTGLIVHTPPLLTAIFKVWFRREHNEIYSQDCIWYNALMLLVYAVAFILLKHGSVFHSGIRAFGLWKART